ncbi:MAG TPA: hypothetical protein VIC55_12740 [Gemmatimonadaceae bacterium]|jgi:hypothetical protein
MRVALVLTVAALGASLAACTHRSPLANGDPASGPTPATYVNVDNQGFSDMNIYAISGGQRVRLGTAIGSRETRFKLPSYLITTLTQLRFLADPIGGNRLPVSEEITVSPGDVVTLRIPSMP